MKLHIGCGNNILKDYVNIDSEPFPSTSGLSFRALNVFDLNRHFQKGTIEEVFSEYFMEHLSPHEILEMVFKIHGLLETNGVLHTVVPNAKRILDYFLSKDRCKKWGHLEFLSYYILGGSSIQQETPHKSIWTEETAKVYIESEGLFKIENIYTELILPFPLTVIARKL